MASPCHGTRPHAGLCDLKKKKKKKLMQHTVDSDKLHSCGLVFKSLIDFAEANPKDGVTEYIKRAAYVGMIMVYDEWTEEGKRVMSISTTDSDKILLEDVPVFYHEFPKVFGKEMQTALPQNGPQDISIDLMPNTNHHEVSFV